MAHESERLLATEIEIKQLKEFKQDIEQRMRSVEKRVISATAISLFIQFVVAIWVAYRAAK